jgi:hypothetical protein
MYFNPPFALLKDGRHRSIAFAEVRLEQKDGMQESAHQADARGDGESPNPLVAFDEQALIDELQRRQRLVTVWSSDDFEFIGNEDPQADHLSDDELQQVQQQAFKACRDSLESVTTARGCDFLQAWWSEHREAMLPRR